MRDELLVKPAAGKHAIEVMALAVEWNQPISAEVIASIRALHASSDPLRQFLPHLEVTKGLTVIIGNDGPAVSTAEIDGLVLSGNKDDGIPAWMVHVRPDLISCSCRAYDRWATTKPQALNVLMPIIELAAAKEYSVKAVGLQYQDAFRVETISPKAAAHRLFSTSAPWLNQHVLSADAPWHVHQGWFSAGQGNRMVHNVLNVDVTVDAQNCLFRINGQHRMLTRNEGGGSAIPIGANDVASALDSLHSDNKRVLSRLLSQSVCQLIGLQDQEKS